MSSKRSDQAEFPLAQLPNELTLEVMEQVPSRDLVNLASTCKSMQVLSNPIRTARDFEVVKCFPAEEHPIFLYERLLRRPHLARQVKRFSVVLDQKKPRQRALPEYVESLVRGYENINKAFKRQKDNLADVVNGLEPVEGLTVADMHQAIRQSERWPVILAILSLLENVEYVIFSIRANSPKAKWCEVLVRTLHRNDQCPARTTVIPGGRTLVIDRPRLELPKLTTVELFINYTVYHNTTMEVSPSIVLPFFSMPRIHYLHIHAPYGPALVHMAASPLCFLPGLSAPKTLKAIWTGDLAIHPRNYLDIIKHVPSLCRLEVNDYYFRPPRQLSDQQGRWITVNKPDHWAKVLEDFIATDLDKLGFRPLQILEESDSMLLEKKHDGPPQSFPRPIHYDWYRRGGHPFEVLDQ